MRRLLLILAILLLLPSVAGAGHLYKERAYQWPWCKYIGGRVEVPFQSEGETIARIDCVTRTHAIEVDYAEKWQEAVGQAIFYSILTGKKPGILLIIEKESDWRYYDRLGRVVEKYDIDVWFISPMLLETIENDKEVSR